VFFIRIATSNYASCGMEVVLDNKAKHCCYCNIISAGEPSTARGSPPKVEEVDSYEVFTSGSHSMVFMNHLEVESTSGIHSAWKSRVDELLAMGVMPMKAFNKIAKEATQVTRPLLPSMEQIYNRKKTVFRTRSKLTTQHAVDCFMKQRMVNFLYSNSHVRYC
jgi:hypothetical protein